jgi:VanZ family protein
MIPLRRSAWTLTAIYAGFHFVMTHIPPGNVPRLGPSNYLLHFLSYGFLAGCVYVSLWLGGATAMRASLVVIAGAALFATFDELLQAPVGRDPEFLDWAVDVAGALVAAGCLSVLRRLLRKNDQPPVTLAPGD